MKVEALLQEAVKCDSDTPLTMIIDILNKVLMINSKALFKRRICFITSGEHIGLYPICSLYCIQHLAAHGAFQCQHICARDHLNGRPDRGVHVEGL